ncbi:hypothetical protein ABBQ32_009616 [Trebouxia sp. C0010 RCD-2024]
MIEDRIEGLLRVHTNIAQTLQIYGELYDRQCEQVKKLREDVNRVHNLVYKLYILPYSPKPASSCRR